MVQAFSKEMEQFYSLADVVISRSGAASLTELSHYGLPAVLIPYPAAADDHQSFNARIFCRERRGQDFGREQDDAGGFIRRGG